MRKAARVTGVTLALCAGAVSSAPPDMARIPGGESRIGADRGRPDEAPSFLAQVAAFDLDRTPVTVSAFAGFVARTKFVTEAERIGTGAVMTFGTGHWSLVKGANWRRPEGPEGPAAEATHPVTQVSWNDAAAYCAAEGKRLPDEIEWEHAARLEEHGAKARTFGFGEAVREGARYRANVWTGVFPVINTASDGYRTTSPVEAFEPGPLGLRDMAGNVWEWTASWYEPYGKDAPHPSPLPSKKDSRGEGERVQRGGSFLCDPKFCYGFRLTARGHAPPDSAHMHVGFRCARDIKGST